MRDSHGLFDYESKSINKKSLKTSSTGKIIRVNNDIELVHPSRPDHSMAAGEESQTLLQIRSD